MCPTHDNATDNAYPLEDEYLEHVTGAGQHGGPMCPKCFSYNVVVDKKLRIVISCNDCGYHI